MDERINKKKRNNLHNRSFPVLNLLNGTLSNLDQEQSITAIPYSCTISRSAGETAFFPSGLIKY